MGFLVWIIVILTIIYVGMLNGCENFYEKALVPSESRVVGPPSQY